MDQINGKKQLFRITINLNNLYSHIDIFNGGILVSIIFGVKPVKKQFSNYANTFGNTIFAA